MENGVIKSKSKICSLLKSLPENKTIPLETVDLSGFDPHDLTELKVICCVVFEDGMIRKVVPT